MHLTKLEYAKERKRLNTKVVQNAIKSLDSEEYQIEIIGATL
jgi:CTP synthase (UTP-ammonia lyase)